MRIRRNRREGAIALFLCFTLLPLLALLALSVDYGFLLFVRTDLQRAGDQAVLAAVRDLIPDKNGYQDEDQVKATIRAYLKANLGSDFAVSDSDIIIGRFNPNSIYSGVEILSDGVMDTVQVNLRRDDVENRSVSLYFARLFNKDSSVVSVTSIAVLQKARYVGPGTSILPIAIQHQAWNKLDFGDTASIYGDGRILDSGGSQIPGNWGTVDIGPTSNSTTALGNQIRNGLSQNDLDSLNSQNRIPSNEYIDSQQSPLWLNGDTGFSSGIKHAIAEQHGTIKLAPIYQTTTSHGGGMEMKIVGWAAVELVDSHFKGNKNSHVTIRRRYTYDAFLYPNNDLTDTSNVIDGAFTSPVLVN